MIVDLFIKELPPKVFGFGHVENMSIILINKLLYVDTLNSLM